MSRLSNTSSRLNMMIGIRLTLVFMVFSFHSSPLYWSAGSPTSVRNDHHITYHHQQVLAWVVLPALVNVMLCNNVILQHLL